MKKLIFITGGTVNTGFCIAEHFAENGYDIAVSSRKQNEAVLAAQKISSKYGVRAKGYGLDLLDVNSIEVVFSQIKQDFGRLDVFVANSANLGINFDVFNTTPEVYDDIMNVNARGTFFCCQQAAFLMKETGGSIVLMGSIQYKGGIRGRTVYSMSKGALASLTRNLAFELAEYGIRVNNLVAGAIHTSRWDMQPELETTRRRAQYPLGMEATAQDIANAVYYLGTDLSSNITGIDLTVDAGLSTCILPYKKRCEE